VLVRRGDELQADSGTHDGVRAGLAEEAEERLVPRLHPETMGGRLWADGSVVRARRLLLVVFRLQRTTSEKERTCSPDLFNFYSGATLFQH
jgi:hypothetical protein